MSAARPVRGLVARGLFQSSPIPTTSARSTPLMLQCRAIHSTATRQRRGSRFRNVKAEELGLLSSKDKMDKFKAEHMPEYTEKELAALSEKYSPEQVEALKAGEAAVNPEDVLIQGRLRDDMFRPGYIDDYAIVDPRFDLKPELKGTPKEPHWATENEFEEEFIEKLTGLVSKTSGDQLTRAMVRALRKVKRSQADPEVIDLTEEELLEMERDPSLAEKYVISPDKTDAEIKKEDKKLLSTAKAMQLNEAVNEAWRKELEQLVATTTAAEIAPSNYDLLKDGPDGTIRMHTAEAVEMGKVPGVAGLYKTATAEEDAADDRGEFTELKQLTGMSIDEIKSIYTKVLVVRYVHNQTRLGKIRSISVMAIAGNGDGRLGLGVGKSVQQDTAERTALALAIRNMKPVRRYENRTIYGNIKSKVGGTIVELEARPPGMFLPISQTRYRLHQC